MKDKPFIVGCDEVGYGALAGPLVVAGVRAPKDWSIPGLNDSKKMTPGSRETMRAKLLPLISKNEIQWHMAERSNNYIDKVGVAKALKESYVEVFKALYNPECLIISDGTLKFDNMGVDDYDMLSMIKADGKIPAVMAASILAKTYRDAKMKEFHLLYPIYGWDHNVGYPRPEHKQAIMQYGPCPLHRMSYAPMRTMNLPDPRQLKLPGT